MSSHALPYTDIPRSQHTKLERHLAQPIQGDGRPLRVPDSGLDTYRLQ
jgi:hypothetical protein